MSIFRSLPLIGVLSLMLLNGCASAKKSVEDIRRRAVLENLEYLSNNHVQWRLDNDGLLPRFGANVDEVIRYSGNLGSDLLPLMSDPDRFVVAHVIMTERRLIRGMYYEWDKTQWNRLKVDVKWDGTVEIDPAQIPEMAHYWEMRAGSQ